MVSDKPTKTVWRESENRTAFRSFVCAAVGAFVGAILPVVAMALYGLWVGLAGEGWRASGDLLKENMLFGAMFMLRVENEWLWIGGTMGAITGFVSAFWNNMVRRTSLTTTRLLVAAGGLVATGLILSLAVLRSEDRSVIDARYLEFCTAVHHEEYEAAYGYLAPAYRQRHTVVQFTASRKGLWLGDCTLDPRHHVTIRGRGAILLPEEVTFVDAYSGPVLWLEKVEGVWFFTGETYWSYD